MLPGASATLSGAGTPRSLPYGVAKAAVHQLLASLSQTKMAGLPEGTRVFGTAPVTLDTPGNREGMPKADFSMWTPLDELGAQIERWCDEKSGEAPENGILYEIITEKGKTRYVPHKAQPAAL